MDFGARTIREAQFREKMRGYNPEDVDTFLEQVARGVEVLEERNRELDERARELEAELRDARAQLSSGKVAPASAPESSPVAKAPPSSGGDTSQELLEIFMIAKRSADEMVAKAESEAAALLGQARTSAEELAATAKAEAAALREVEISRLAVEVANQQAKRDALLQELHRLGDLASGARTKVRSALSTALDALDKSFLDLYSSEEEEAIASREDTPGIFDEVDFDDEADGGIE